MPSIYFFRHGKDDDTFRGGWSQRGMIEEGFRQARTLANYLAHHRSEFVFSQLISSDLRRAAETAVEICGTLNIPIELSPEWRETNNGVLAGMPNEQALQMYPGLFYNSLGMDDQYPGGESPRENYERIKIAFEKLSSVVLTRQTASEVGVVIHGGVINIVYHIVKGLQWSNKNPLLPAEVTSIHKLEYVSKRWIFTIENLREHLRLTE